MKLILVNSVTFLSDGASLYEVFRQACAVTSPQWTQQGPLVDDWTSPLDAAGGLILWDSDGRLERIEPPYPDAEDRANDTLYDLGRAGGIFGLVRATYASSGGRIVALCETQGEWVITVSRGCYGLFTAPYDGLTERAIRAADPDARILYVAMQR